jgi:hypothetical protein
MDTPPEQQLSVLPARVPIAQAQSERVQQKR